MDTNPDGTVILQIGRFVDKSYSVHMVADADGPVRTAMYFVWDGTAWPNLACRPDDQGVNEGTFLTLFRGNDLHRWEDYQGVRGGNVDDLQPPVRTKYASMENSWQHGWRASASGIVRLGDGVMSFFTWDMSKETFITSPAVDPEGMRAAYLVARNGAVFWGTSNSYRAGINAWDPIGGARPLIRWVGDKTRGAGNFGTDGTDMVWCQGEGKAPDETVFPVRSIMTAPFTTDPAKLKPRRLRSSPKDRIAGAPAQVGCGYAGLEGPAGDIIVVRLSDGWSWFVPQTPERRIYRTLGLTCTELFATGEMHGRYTIARVRLDSLGPGFAPD